MTALPDVFRPRLDILPPPQRALWPELASVPAGFVLYGGTALALHLGHRQSVDFDFFGPDDFTPAALVARVAILAAAEITQQAPSTLSVIVDRGGPVSLSFFGLPRIRRLRPPHVAPDVGVRVASLLDLAGTKAAVVQQRAEAKDYIDLHAILEGGGLDLPTALSAAAAIYGERFNPLVTLKALSYFDDGDLRRLPEDVKRRLAHAAADVDAARLPGVPAEGGAR